MKRKLCLGICFAAAVAMMACGKKGPTIEEVAEGLQGSPVSSASATIDLDVDVNANYNMEDLSASTGFTLYADMENADRSDQMRMHIHDIAADKLKVSDSAKSLFGTYADTLVVVFNGYLPALKDVEAYLLLDEMKMYAYYGNNWYVYSDLDVSAASSSMTVSAEDQEKAKKVAKDLLIEYGVLGEDTLSVEGENCYTVTLQLQGDTLKNYVESIYEATGAMDAFEEGIAQMEVLGLPEKTLWNAISIDSVYYAAEGDYHPVKTESTVKIDVLMIAMAFEDQIRASGFDLDAAKSAEITFVYAAVLKDVGKTDVDVPGSVQKMAMDLTGYSINGILNARSEGDEDIDDDPDSGSGDDDDEGIDLFLQADGSYDLCTLDGDRLLKVYPADGFSYDEGDIWGGRYVYFTNGSATDFATYCVSVFPEAELVAVYNGETIPAESCYVGYKADFTELGEIEGMKVLLAHSTAGLDYDEDGVKDYDYDEYVVVIPYFSSEADENNGTYSMAQINYYGKPWENWEKEEIITFVEQIIGK